MSMETVRLHISPLTPESYAIVVPRSLHDSVSAVEYYSLPTFPDKSYGYIELPREDAERFKKRLNGALVKGARIKIEKARPKRTVDHAADDRQEEVVVRLRDSKAPDEGVIRGVQLPGNRRVRRGWTELAMGKKVKKEKAADGAVANKSRAEKSKYTDKEELLFKTKVKGAAVSSKESGKKRKREDDVTTVHEFKQTTKFPSFLRDQSADKSKSTTEYDPEKGWVDKDGNVVEGPRRSRRRQSEDQAKPVSRASKTKKAAAEVTKAAQKLSIRSAKGRSVALPVEESDDEETSSSGSSDADDDEDEEDEEDAEDNGSPLSKTTLAKETSQSDLESSDAESNEQRESSTKLTVETTPKPERTIPSLEIQPVSAASEKSGEVHPLEALFKKPKGNAKKPPGLELKIPQAFTFFGGDDDNDSEDGDVPTALPLLPQTPFTQADMRFRRERSAAPTPDTAAPTKLLFGPVMDKPLPGSAGNDEGKGDSEDDEEEMGDDADDDNDDAGGVDAASTGGKKGRSEFAEKWFWENRGDNNRAWKKRRREVSKQKRYEGNKRRTRSSAA